MGTSCHLLAMSGSLRAASTNTAVLRTAKVVAPAGTSVTIFDALDALPHFNPDDDTDGVDAAVAHLRGAIRTADALLISTPEYAGALPGSFKNLLDWTVGGMEISDKPVAWINAAALGRAARAHESLRTVLGYVNADIVYDACADIPVPHGAVGSDGTIADQAIRAQIAAVVRALTDHVALLERRNTPVSGDTATPR